MLEKRRLGVLNIVWKGKEMSWASFMWSLVSRAFSETFEKMSPMREHFGNNNMSKERYGTTTDMLQKSYW